MLSDAAAALAALITAGSILWLAFVVWFWVSVASSLRRIADAADLYRIEKEVEIDSAVEP